MHNPVRKLNPLLRLAAISGVETAIKLHIRRGDDLDARDGAGATPLILAAGRRRVGVVKLLLDAEANPALADQSGMDALAHALKSGCSETIAILTDAMARLAVTEPAKGPSKEMVKSTAEGVDRISAALQEDNSRGGRVLGLDEQPTSVEALDVVLPADNDRTATLGEGWPPVTVARLSPPITEVLSESIPNVSALNDELLHDFFSDDWEAEEEVSAPKGDETVVEQARQVHEAIRQHKVVDRDEDWGDVDLHLPARAVPLARDDGGSSIRSLLLAALREGMVEERALIDICSNVDGSRNEEAERLLAFVTGELGATVVEWTGSNESFPLESSMEEDRLLAEAVEFAEDLASGRNDPFRFYSKDIRGDLLEANEEIALGGEMEENGRAAIAALAVWPEGLSAVFTAAARVAAGEADVESFCAGPEPSSGEEPTSHPQGTDDEEEGDSRLDDDAIFFVNAIAAVEAASGDVSRVTEALEEARLTRGFLMELADKAGEDQAGRDFVEAIGRQTKARERMILCNLRLALSIAKKHLWSGIPLDDLVQEANIGLMKAVERYDWRRGFRFSTYATWWIRQQVSRSIADTGRVVRAPVHIQETARKVLREREAEEGRLGHSETESETARRIGMPLCKTRMLLTMFEDVVSLEEVDPDSGLSRIDRLCDEKALDPADVADTRSLRRVLLNMLDDLDERGREVVFLRFGLKGGEAMTLEEIGQHFGVTRERIRQIESKAIGKLSHRNKREILWPFLGDGYAPTCAPPPDRLKTEAASNAEEQVSPGEEARDLSKAPVEREAPSVERPTPVRGGEQVPPDVTAPTTLAPLLVGNPISRIADEARALGLKVEDRRAQGGDLRIVVSFASPQKIRAFGRKLLASGFRQIQRDVFAK